MLIDQLPEISDANDADEMPIEQGTTTRKIKILNLLKGVVSKAGDTITGGLTILSYLAIQRSSGNAIAIDDLADDSTVSPSPARNGITLSFRDKNGVTLGSLRARHTTSSYKGLYLYGNNSSAPSGSQTNGLYLMVNDSGEKLVTLSDPAAWREALGLGTNGALPITIAQGGTGHNGVKNNSTINNIATAGSGFTITSAIVNQWGRVAMFQIAVKKTAAVTSETEMAPFTLTDAYKPNMATGATCNSSTIKYTRIASGVVYAYGTWAANAAKVFYGTYITAQNNSD